MRTIDVDAILRTHGPNYGAVKDELMRQFCALYIAALLEQTKGNKSAAAKLAKVERSALRRLQRRGAEPPSAE